MALQRFSTSILVTMILASAIILSACGVKPSRLDPPPGKEETSFPNTYPHPDETDY